MSIVDYIAVTVIILIIGAALFYIIRAKKRGQKCIGCPYSRECAGRCSCNCSGCQSDKSDKSE